MLGPHADADRDKLLLVLDHLLSNAVKYGRVGGSITVRTEAVTPLEHGAGREVAISVTDTGRGIAPADLPNLFVPFDRLGVTSSIAGTGLGLAISRGFVEAMHGTISAANRSDRSGAIITIRLPVPAASNALDTAA